MLSYKKHLLFYLLMVSIILMISACSNDDDSESLPNVDSVPEFKSIDTEIFTLPDRAFNFVASISDPAGIKSVNIKYDDWFLDKTISKPDNPVTYDLNYMFKVPKNAVPRTTHIILVTAENIGGKTTSQEVSVTLDQDVNDPIINLVNLSSDNITINSADGINYVGDLLIEVRDDRKLKTLVIESEFYSEVIELTETSQTLELSFNTMVDAGSYDIKFTLSDTSDNKVEVVKTFIFINDVSYPEMFLVDTTDSSIFSKVLSGYPYEFENSIETDEVNKVFRINYYAPSDNTEIRFIPQRTSFSPVSIGASLTNEGKILIGSDETINPIIIESAGYYQISLDLRFFNYTIVPLTAPSNPDVPAQFTGLYATGGGVSVNGTDLPGYSPPNSLPFTQVPGNNLRYKATIAFNGENVNFILIGNQSSYSVFWRVTEPGDLNNTIKTGSSRRNRNRICNTTCW